MRVPTLQGLIKRRLLVNFRADPDAVRRLLPAPFRPKLHGEHAIVGICLIRLEQVRPRGWPAAMGLTSENAAHRLAVEWTDDVGDHEGVYIPRRDTGSRLNHWAGGRIFPGEHALARFAVTEVAGQIDFSMNSVDGDVSIRLIGEETDTLPSSSCFENLAEASAFFQTGCLGYSVTCDPRRLDGIRLETLDWRVGALAVSEASSSYFEDPARFPLGSIVFDHALIMRDILHEWHQADDFHVTPGTLQNEPALRV